MDNALPLAGASAACDWIEVSPEMTAVIGTVGPTDFPIPGDAMILAFGLGGEGEPAAVHVGTRGGIGEGIVLFVSRGAVRRLGGRLPRTGESYHLTSELRAIVLALRDGRSGAETRNVYRLAKSIELLCETLELLANDRLVPLVGDGALSPDDTRRVLAARALIDERWSEKLTLEGISRACGINRTKLTRGFKDMFDCTVTEALAEKRLMHARRMLLTTDKPVSSIGYENGYLNNASFARAFSRRFGMAPSFLRSHGAAA